MVESAAKRKRRELDALLRWRDGQAGSGRVVPETLTDEVLRSIAYSPYRAQDEIRNVLTQHGVVQFAEVYALEMARVLGEPGSSDLSARGDNGGLDNPRTAEAKEYDTRLPSQPAPPTPTVNGVIGEAAGEAAIGDAITSTLLQGDTSTPTKDTSRLRAEIMVAETSADQISSEGFAPCALGLPDGEPLKLDIEILEDEGYRVSWPAEVVEDGVAIFRSVTDDFEQPDSPDWGHLIACGTMLSVEDHQPFSGAVRYVQVWCNIGRDEVEAKKARPRLYGESTVVSPVQDFMVREDAGKVVGQWNVFPEVQRVHLFRTPVEAARKGLARPQFRILTDSDNLEGFVDDNAERGRRYLYEAIAEVQVDGVGQLSAPRGKVVTVSVVLESANDLEVQQHGDGTDRQLDISWTPPERAKVVVFQTRELPRVAPEDGELSLEQLASGGLKAEEMLTYPTVRYPESRVGLKNVPWPGGWPMAYFTPVTVYGEMGLVGTTRSSVRVGAVSDAMLQERVSEQRLTFVWPAGADSVLVYLSAPGVDTTAIMGSEPLLEISADAYKQPLGVRLPHTLPPERASTLHLVPCTFEGGKRYFGIASVIGYGGLLRVSYRVELRRKQRLFGDKLLELTISSELQVKPSPPFALLMNAGRLPLSINDGEPLAVTPVGSVEQPPSARVLPDQLGPNNQAQAWVADLARVHRKAGLAYYVRLFADLPAQELRRVAVLDPPLSSLTIQ